MARALARAFKETALALDRLGMSLQGRYAFREEREFRPLQPRTLPFLAPAGLQQAHHEPLPLQ